MKTDHKEIIIKNLEEDKFWQLNETEFNEFISGLSKEKQNQMFYILYNGVRELSKTIIKM